MNIGFGGAAVSNLVTFPANQTQLTINLAVDGVYDDSIVEGTEYATLAIGSGTGYTASSMSHPPGIVQINHSGGETPERRRALLRFPVSLTFAPIACTLRQASLRVAP